MSGGDVAPHTLITGGSSGIGAAMARRLALSRGVITLLARDEGRLRDAALAIEKDRKSTVSTQSADVTNSMILKAAIMQAEARSGPITTLIACAGAALPGRFEDIPDATFRHLMEVNYFGVLNTLRLTLPQMRARGNGRALIVGSGAALIGLPGYTAYAPSKFAVRGLAEALRAEYRPHNIQISICHPPDVDTPQLAAERPLRPPENAAIASAAKVWSADAIAVHTLRCFAKGATDIYPGWEMTALGRGASLFKPMLDRRFDRIARRAMKDIALHDPST